MIEATKGYRASDGSLHLSVDLAQRAELLSLFSWVEPTSTSQGIVDYIVDHTDKIVDILTTKPRSRPKMRKVNRGKAATPATVKAGIKKMREAVDAPQADEVAA